MSTTMLRGCGVSQDGDQDKVADTFKNVGGEVVRVGVADSLKPALNGVAPTGVTVATDGSTVWFDGTQGPARQFGGHRPAGTTSGSV